MALSAEAFIDQLQGEIRARHANLDHPFAKRLIAGKLTKEHLRAWVCQRYKGITGIGMQNVAPLFIKAPDEGARRHIWELLGDEGGYAGEEPSHSEWLFTFGEALGLGREEIEHAEPLPETIAVRNFFLNKMHMGTFMEGLMSMVAVERQNPEGFASWANSLQERYGVRKEDLVFFLGHVEADSEESGHSGEGWEMVRLYANTDEAQEDVLRAVRESLAMYWLFMDGINRATEG